MMSPKALAEKLKIAVKEKLANLENRVLIEATEEGVRIQIIDPDGTLFPAGSAEPTKTLKDILKVVADNIKDMGNLIALEGHTDSSPYNVGRNTNWELSSSRASAARYLLNADGVDPDRIARVVGFADKHPYIENDPKDPRNRRISILVMQERLAKTETSPAEEQKPAPPPPGVNIIEPKMAPEDQDRMLKQMKEEQDRKAAAEKPKTEANRQWAADRREAPGALFKGTPFTPVIPGAGSQKTFKSAEKPSRMQIKEQPAVVPKAETQKGKEDPSAMRILEPKTPPGLNIIEPRKPQKQ
jgi:flagellar motor protein MotB